MSNELYSLESLRKCVRYVKAMVDMAFTDEEAHFGVHEGGWTDDKPWLLILRVKPAIRQQFTIDHVEALIKPHTFLDQVDHGGLVSTQQYAAGMFDILIGRLMDKAVDPPAMMRMVRERIEAEAAARGIEPPSGFEEWKVGGVSDN